MEQSDCTNGDLRLENGDILGGRLEICLNQVWGTVCRDSFTRNEAAVVCKQLNLLSGT